MDEFGMGSHSTHTPYGPVRNPLNIHLSAGGSSGGSAAAISSNLVDLALGSDTGGSIRLPASYCGVVGFKPTYGRISRDGLVSYASSLDTIGFVCSDLTVGGIAFEVLKGTGGLKDMTSFQRTLPIKTLDKGDSKGRHGLCGLVVGVAEQMMPSILQKEAKDNLRLALDRLVNLGAEIRTISIPILNFALATYYIHAMIESASCLSRYPLDGMRNADFGEHVKQRISLGRYLASHRNYNRFFGKATSIRDQICFELNQALDTVDILISPTSIGAAPNLTSITNSDESEMFTPQRWEGILQSNFDNSHLEPLQADLLTVPASLARLPAISLPIHSDEVCGIQLIGGHSRDEELLEISKMLMDH
jgi:aspartyl-tRNA(Asn)/glutamyl-tRNA(Gln) amidotransferase subunit A